MEAGLHFSYYQHGASRMTIRVFTQNLRRLVVHRMQNLMNYTKKYVCYSSETAREEKSKTQSAGFYRAICRGN